MGNILILIALCKVSSLHPPTKLLFRCLALTNLCVGLVTQPLGAVIALHLSDHDITDINTNVILPYVNEVNTGSAFIFCDVSIMVSTAISMDRLLALLMGLRYKHVVTLRRVRTIVICVWLIAILVTLIGSSWSYRFSIIVASVLVMLSLVISIFSYTKILHHLLKFKCLVSKDNQTNKQIH